jgi:DNA-binding MarR family transcriptional regulator
VANRAQIAQRRLQAEAALNLSRIQRELERRIDVLLRGERLEDVTPQQANALMILFQDKTPMTARQLAAQMNLSEVTVGRFVRALESAGWILREAHPDDSRAILLSPSRKAYRAFPRFLAVSNAILSDTFAGMGEADVRALVELTERARANLADHASGGSASGGSASTRGGVLKREAATVRKGPTQRTVTRAARAAKTKRP